MKELDAIMGTLQNTSAIADQLGRLKVDGVDTVYPCIWFGDMPKEQTNYPQIRIKTASPDNKGRAILFPLFDVLLIDKNKGMDYNTAILGQDLARDIVNVLDYINHSNGVMTYANKQTQIYEADKIYTPVEVQATFKEN